MKAVRRLFGLATIISLVWVLITGLTMPPVDNEVVFDALDALKLIWLGLAFVVASNMMGGVVDQPLNVVALVVYWLFRSLSTSGGPDPVYVSNAEKAMGFALLVLVPVIQLVDIFFQRLQKDEPPQ